MILLRLPKAPMAMTFFLAQPYSSSSSLYSFSHSHFSLIPKPHSLTINPTLKPFHLPSSPKSTLSPSQPQTLSTSDTTHPQIETPQEDFDTQIQVSLENLFVPPETEIGDGTSALTSRILRGSNIVLSKYARDAQVAQAEFVKSSVATEDCPSDGLPEYASAPKDLRTDWAKFTKDYFLNRSKLVSVFLLIDASIPAKSIDLEYASWLAQNQIPMTLIFTKCDKRKKKKNGGKRPEENVKDFQELVRGFFKTVPPWIMTSSVTNQGRDEILLHMAQLRNYWLKH
ncbi:hypothetical protein G4B88_009026 [Cannabis sativa]|uniref:GTP-binding protein n=1 Tax=Cannabis sativa TaxID=3483 RepID=A0A7J6HSA0_CANSA|nr:hypothetical protein G4B88_009026 [Cannabis sativa]